MRCVVHSNIKFFIVLIFIGCFRLDCYSSLVYLVDFLGAQRSSFFLFLSVSVRVSPMR